MKFEAEARVREGTDSKGLAQNRKARGEKEVQGNWAFWVQTGDPQPGGEQGNNHRGAL